MLPSAKGYGEANRIPEMLSHRDQQSLTSVLYDNREKQLICLSHSWSGILLPIAECIANRQHLATWSEESKLQTSLVTEPRIISNKYSQLADCPTIMLGMEKKTLARLVATYQVSGYFLNFLMQKSRIWINGCNWSYYHIQAHDIPCHSLHSICFLHNPNRLTEWEHGKNQHLCILPVLMVAVIAEIHPEMQCGFWFTIFAGRENWWLPLGPFSPNSPIPQVREPVGESASCWVCLSQVCIPELG